MKNKTSVNVLTIYSIFLGAILLMAFLTTDYARHLLFAVFLCVLLIGSGIAGLALNNVNKRHTIKFVVISIFVILMIFYHNSEVFNLGIFEKQFVMEFLLATPIVFSVYFFFNQKDNPQPNDYSIKKSSNKTEDKIKELHKLKEDGLITVAQFEIAVLKVLEGK